MREIRMNGKIPILFLFFYFIYSFKTVLLSTAIQDSSIDVLKDTFNILSIVLSGISVFYISKKERVLSFFIGMLLVFNAVIYHTVALYSYFILFCMVCLAKKIEFKELLKIIMLSNILIIIIMIPFISFSDTFFRLDDRFGERLTLGFGNANVMAQFLIMFFSALVLFITNRTKGLILKNLFLLLLFIMIGFVVYYSGSRTGLAMISLCFIGFVWAINSRKTLVGKKFKFLYLFCALGIIAFQYYSVSNFNANGILIAINQMLAGRVFYSYRLISSLGGTPILHGMNIDNFMPIDFFYIQYFYSLGLVTAAAFMLFYFKSFWQHSYSKPSAVILLTCLMATATEAYFMIPLYNLSLFMIYHKKKSD